MFRVARIDSRRAEALEPLGTKRKFWYTDRQTSRRVLFKAEERGTGEDWAEKLACEFCRLLGLPHVHYELAWDEALETPGVVCDSCVPKPMSLVLGNQLLLERDPDYPAQEKYRGRAHTVNAVAEVVGALALPQAVWLEGLPPGIDSALDVFVGYVMLDAWIANQDRHHENWAAIRDGEGLYLAPTFDHGASMARNLSDGERHDRLTTCDSGRMIGPFARRAKSAFFADAADSRPMTTVAAWAAFAGKAPQAATIWRDRLADVTVGEVEELLAMVPPQRMSRICRDFTARLLRENQTRIINGDEE